MNINDKVGYAKTFYTMGYAHMAAGEMEDAKRNFEEAVKKVEGCDMPALVAYYSYQYALALIRMGEKEPALRILKKSLHTYKLIKAEGYVLRIQKDIEDLSKS